MGICDSKSDSTNSQEKSIAVKAEGCLDTHNTPMSLDEIKDLYSNESSMCKIKVKNEKGNNVIGTGFFCEINDKDIPFKKVLFTNNHILNEKNKENNIELSNEIEFEYLNKIKKIKMIKNRRKYTNKNIDYTCIEIFEEDEIKQFFKIDDSYFDNINKLKTKEIFILQYPNDEELNFSSGKILNIENNEIHHSAATYYGSSGSPLIKRYNNKLILGMHCGDVKNKDKKVLFNLAIPFDIIINDIKSKININPSKNNTIINLIYYKKKESHFLFPDSRNNIFGSNKSSYIRIIYRLRRRVNICKIYLIFSRFYPCCIIFYF